MPANASKRISDVRISPDNQTVLKQLGPLQELAGTWKGKGFNLIARPDFHDQTDLYLQLNQTRETLRFEPIGSSIPNRGFGQDDIELFGLTYLQQIADAGLDGALHIGRAYGSCNRPRPFRPKTLLRQGNSWLGWARSLTATRCWPKVSLSLLIVPRC
jgi:hypothetical protein